MSTQKIRTGIIGVNVNYGWGSWAHMPALLSLPDYELTAVCTAHKDTAGESANRFGARLAFTDYNQMVQHPDIDLVTVCVGTPLHHDMVISALAASKHVFCEWPLGANTNEAEAIASKARSVGVRHMVGLQARGDPALLRLRELVAEGYVGEVLSVDMTAFQPDILKWGAIRPWMADRTKGANTLTIATGHATDALCFCVGEFQELTARVTTRVTSWKTDANGTVEVTSPDNILIHGSLGNGAVVSVHVAHQPWSVSGSRIEIYGREGTLVAATPQGHVQFFGVRLWGGRSKDKGLKELPIPDRLNWVPDNVSRDVPYNVAQLYWLLSKGIHDGEVSDPDFDLALRRHRLLDAIQLSSDQGKTVEVI